MAIPLMLLITENPRGGGYLVYPYAGMLSRTIQHGPTGAARTLRGLNEAVMEAMALDLVDPVTGEGQAPPMPSSILAEIQSAVKPWSHALLDFDPKSGRYDVTPEDFGGRLSGTLRQAAASVASTDPELAFDLVHISQGPIENRVAMCWGLQSADEFTEK